MKRQHLRQATDDGLLRLWEKVQHLKGSEALSNAIREECIARQDAGKWGVAHVTPRLHIPEKAPRI